MTASTGPLTWTKLVTSCSTNTNPFSPNKWEMFSTDPVRRLSMATTSSPRRTSDSQMWDPRKPAPPVTTMRATSAPADGVVGEAPAADGGGVEQVAAVHQTAFGHHAADFLEVEPPELVPLREHEQHGRPFARRVGIGGHLEAVDALGHGRVIGPDAGPALAEAIQDFDRRRPPQ